MLFHLFVQHVIHEQLTTKLAEQMVLLSKSPLSALVAALSLVCLVINKHKNKKKTRIYGLNSDLESFSLNFSEYSSILRNLENFCYKLLVISYFKGMVFISK